jgi:hypothetical protein
MSDEERSYRRAASFLRDFHRSRSLDVIFEEEDDDDQGQAPAFPMMKKKRACLCLADMVADTAEDDSMDDHSSDNNISNSGEDSVAVDSTSSTEDRDYRRRNTSHQTSNMVYTFTYSSTVKLKRESS